jgi:transposase
MRDLSAVQCRSIPTRPHHDVKLLPAQFVKPFLKGQKNDFRDAEAVAEAVQRPTMRFVPTKSVSSARPAGLHRARSRLVSQRTAIVNQIPLQAMRVSLFASAVATTMRLTAASSQRPKLCLGQLAGRNSTTRATCTKSMRR